MNEYRHLPNIDRLSIVSGMILLAYALAAYVHVPEQSLSLQLPGFLFEIKINIFTIISLIVALLAASGCDWIIASHPRIGEQRRWYHWIIPAMTAMVIGVPLNAISLSPAWWVIFAMGGFLLLGVLAAEYISVDPEDSLYSLACIGLTVVSLSLFLILAIALRGAGLRLYSVLSALVPASALVAARSLHLRLSGHWRFAWVGGITLILAQLSICVFYLPLKPVPFGMVLLSVMYGLVSLAGNIEEGYPSSRVWIEPTLMSALFLVLAFV